jgi:hypothetical protein
LAVEQFEPIYVVPEGTARPTEFGKRWLDQRLESFERFGRVIKDVLGEATKLQSAWDRRLRTLVAEGVPTAMASGLSQYSMSHVVDHMDGKTSFTMPAVVTMALGTAAPTSTTTGVWGATETTNYTGYARLTITPGTQMNAATVATPSVATNSAVLTFAACTGGTATELGFLIADNATINTGNALWFGSLTSVTISTTQTPPTVAAAALSLSLNST